MHTPVRAIDEQRREQQVSFKAEAYYRKYEQYISALESEHCLLNKVRGGNITPHDVYALGMMLEGTDEYLDMCEETGTVNRLGRLPSVVHDVVVASYANSPIAVIATVQPIQEETGMVYFKDVVAQTTRGNITSGDTLFSSDAIGKSPRGLSSEGYSANLGDLVDATSAYTGTAVSANAPVPIRKGKVSVTVTFQNGGSADETIVARDYEADGVLVGKDISGTINYETGAWTINLRNAPVAADAGNDVTIDYGVDQEGQASLQAAIPQLRHKNVNAQVYALKGSVGLEQQFVMRRRFGRMAEDDLAADLVQAVNTEILTVMIYKIVQEYAATGRTPLSFSKGSVANGVAYKDHKDQLKDRISEMEANIIGYAGRGTANVLLCGRNVCAIIQTLPGFTKLSDGMSIGTHLFGMLDGAAVVRVPETAVLNADHMYALHKGVSAWDATVAYAPYMPLVMTDTVPVSANPLLQTKAAAIWAAVEVLIPNLLERTNVTA